MAHASADFSKAMRPISEKELVHERLGDRFASALSEYDTLRRIEVLVDEFLGDVKGQRALEVGSGLGFFARALQDRGASVVASDIGEELLRRVKATVGCECVRVDALALVDHFGPDSFDIVLSSECIEHTPIPADAVRQMARVLKPGGRLALSAPNLLWYPVVKLATAAGLRPFDGLENFSTFGSLRRTLEEEGLAVLQERGLHLFPFQAKLFRVSRWCDKNLQIFRGLMINLCVLARKRDRT